MPTKEVFLAPRISYIFHAFTSMPTRCDERPLELVAVAGIQEPFLVRIYFSVCNRSTSQKGLPLPLLSSSACIMVFSPKCRRWTAEGPPSKSPNDTLGARILLGKRTKREILTRQKQACFHKSVHSFIQEYENLTTSESEVVTTDLSKVTMSASQSFMKARYLPTNHLE